VKVGLGEGFQAIRNIRDLVFVQGMTGYYPLQFRCIIVFIENSNIISFKLISFWIIKMDLK